MPDESGFAPRGRAAARTLGTQLWIFTVSGADVAGKAREGNGAATAAEQRLNEVLGQVRPWSRRSEEPAGPLDVHSGDHDPEREVRGEYLTRALVESPEDNGWRPFVRRGGRQPVVRVEDAVITSVLDLRAADLPYLLEFVRCRFERPPDLRQASLAGLVFARCRMPGLQAQNLSTTNDAALTECTSSDVLNLADAQFGGSLLLNDSELRNPRGRVVYADRLSVGGALLAMRLRTAGEIRLPGAKISGNLTLTGSALRHRGRTALNASGIDVGGSLRCEHDPNVSDAFSVAGRLVLPSARVQGDVRLRGSTVDPGARSPKYDESREDDPLNAVVLDRGEIRGDVQLDHGFRCYGTLRAVSCRIRGSLHMSGTLVDLSWYRSPRESVHHPLRAVRLEGTEVLGSIRASGAALRGQLRIADLHVHGSFLLNRAELDGPRTDVVRGDRLRIGSDLACREADISGSLQLEGASIGANLDLRATNLLKPAWHRHRLGYKPALDLGTANIGRDLVCASGNRPFRAAGQVRLRRAVIGRQSNFWYCVLGEEPERPSLHAFGLVTQELSLLPSEPPRGPVVLRQAQCELFGDNDTLWKASNGLDFEDFVYENFSQPIEATDHATVRERLQRLATASGRRYQPGPYDQLAAVLRDNGHEEHATTVLVAKQRRRYQAIASASRPALRPSVRLWSLLQRVTVSYGYRPLRALLWLLAFAAAGTTWFSVYPLTEPINQDDRPVWDPFLYTVDQLVPIVNLGHDVMWQADGSSKWITVVLIAAGWILATTVAAGITRALRRDH